LPILLLLLLECLEKPSEDIFEKEGQGKGEIYKTEKNSTLTSDKG
jgi:hypothetical protein